MDSRNHSEICIILDRRKLHAKAVQIIVRGANEETVFVLKDVTVNASDSSAEALVPDVAGYRITRHPPQKANRAD